jgi:uncharacterized iron-regulated protein
MDRTAPALVSSLLVLACASGPGAVPGHEPPSGAAAWQSPLRRDHPLVGKIWSPSQARFVEPAELLQAATRADFVLLGETHDNADHHLLQAWLLRAIVDAGRRPAVAFEMLGTDQQADLDRALAGPATADDIRKAVRWDESGGWSFDFYRPLFELALVAKLPIVAANLPRDMAREVARGGREALPEGLRARLAREEPLSEEVRAALRKEMSESHCGALPESMLDPMALVQRTWNAHMAERLEDAGKVRGGVLVTGSGHGRTDRGVPAHLARDVAGRPIVSVSFQEVLSKRADPAQYAEDYGAPTLPFDYVVFTPGAKREDPCEKMREHMRSRPAK